MNASESDSVDAPSEDIPHLLAFHTRQMGPLRIDAIPYRPTLHAIWPYMSQWTRDLRGAVL